MDLNHIWRFKMFLDNVLCHNGPKSELWVFSGAEFGRWGNYPNFSFFKCLVFTTLLTSHINHRAFKFCYLLFLRFQWIVKIKITCFSNRIHFVGNNNMHRYIFDGSIKYWNTYTPLDTKIIYFKFCFLASSDYMQWINYFDGALVDFIFLRILSIT